MADAERRMLSGTEALVELPLLQRRIDSASGHDTAGFVTGYRGSPLGGYDQALVAAKDRLDAVNVRFQPGLNEDLAATAIWGTQQVGLLPGATVAGVFGIWYGKGPGVDRSLDALKHGNAAGTSALGGVLLIAGDDHGCVSSTLPHQSGPVFAAASIPVLAPSSVQEMIEFGLIGIAMSRASGCWIAMTVASQIVETSSVVDLDHPTVSLPPAAADVHLRWPDPPLAQERRLHETKLPAARAFAADSGLDRVVVDAPGARLTIVTTGKAYGDVMAALALLPGASVRVVKVGFAWPLGDWIADWLGSVDEVLVVEEKAGFVENQLARLLFNRPDHPRLVGKRDEDGLPLLPTIAELAPPLIARAIAERLALLTGERFGLIAAAAPVANGVLPIRAPFFCAGCPHNTSTVVPDGSRAMGGIGCHGMATWMPDRATAFLTQMGAEGATWIGQAPFTTERHVFQNMGDGTYNHSGLLAIRAAIAAGVNITYKILYNDAVAMTGGQPHEGALTAEAIAAQVSAEGARKVVVVSEQPDRFPRAAFAPGIELRDRSELDAVQRDLRGVPGVTVIVYDQTCAAELRRRRRTEPALRRTRHVVINPDVCEGCGDCSVQSNCIAIQPFETPLGRKRQVDPGSCNQDYSCLKGFCPSFVTIDVETSAPGTAYAEAPPAVPLPVPVAHHADIVISGIGGTGVVTLGMILAKAAAIDGMACSVLDVTGLSQKNGAVMTQVRLGSDSSHGSRVTEGAATLALACDLIAATAADALSRCGPGTMLVANGDVTATAAFVRDGGIDLGRDTATRQLSQACGEATIIGAGSFARDRLGHPLGSNLLLLGLAWQRGAIPLSLPAMEHAIAAVAKGAANASAFGWGRAIAAEPSLAGDPAGTTPTLEAIIADRITRLTGYQDAAYAHRYATRVAAVATAGSEELTRVYAIALYRLMAIKDEYEVARLHLDPTFDAAIAGRFGPHAKRRYLLAPPLLGTRKRDFGGWIRPLFRLLAAARGIRNSAIDPFRWTTERRTDCILLAEFEADMATRLATLGPADVDALIERVEATGLIRGYGHVRAASIATYRAALSDRDA